MGTMSNTYNIATRDRLLSFTESLRNMSDNVWNGWNADRQRRVLPGRFNTDLIYALEIVSHERSHRYHTSTPVDTFDRVLALLGDLRQEDKGGRDWAYQLQRLSALCAEYRAEDGSKEVQGYT